MNYATEPAKAARTLGWRPDARVSSQADDVDMVARAVDEASERLRELRADERDDLAAGGLALALALGATELYPQLALPMFVGGLVLVARAMKATWHRWDLVDRLTGERDAYAIPEVLARASREATFERRQAFAALLRSWLSSPWPGLEPRVTAARADIEALIAELEDDGLDLDVEAAVACSRLLCDGLPGEDVRAQVRHIRSGFTGAASR